MVVKRLQKEKSYFSLFFAKKIKWVEKGEWKKKKRGSDKELNEINRL